ncbi:MAG: outer membrane protein transport protein [Pseudomonadota bacterium]|nr:outer membrane protein transport protein [Pseudomonadota bacterium]MDO7710894.1 outer membrane protein transport protein [Pseudomonadota bacterium]
MSFLRQLLVTSLLALFISPAFATNGYLAHGYGIKSRGMAGAGVALPQETLGAAINPASIAFIGNRVDISAALFSPRRSYTATGPQSETNPSSLVPGQVDSGREYFVIPEMGASWQLDNHKSLGLLLYGNGGMNTSYAATDTAGGSFSGATGVDLSQLFLSPTFAYRFDNDASIGLSAILAYQRFAARGLSNFAGLSNSPQNLTNNGHDNSFGAGINLGFILPVSEQFTLGGGYRSRVYMSELDNYQGLFAQQGDMDIPSSATIGLAWRATGNLTVALDVQKTWYSSIDAVGNKMMPSFTSCATRSTLSDPSCLGGNNGIGFGWKDMTTLKLGMQYETTNDWTWRAGYSHGNQPIPESEVFFNILAPGVMEQHFTTGFTKKFDNGRQEINFAAMYAPAKSISGPISSTQTVELEMKQYQLELGWSLLF